MKKVARSHSQIPQVRLPTARTRVRTHIHCKNDRTLQSHKYDCLRHALAFAPTSLTKSDRTFKSHKYDCLRHAARSHRHPSPNTIMLRIAARTHF
ncbi:hypothetical protein [Argonema antarcticum]|uniref:hypothetical protein n=1 Tax=Argonema antarcticum TaxID=2942763 RepID=UPI0030846E4C